MPLTLRPYQEEALSALTKFFAERNDNPCVVLPTGSGKSYVIAELIRRMIALKADFRCIVLAHRLELVEQNGEELGNVDDEIDIGVYCAALGQRDVDEHVIFAMINSVYDRANEFEPFDMVIIDEAHHIPVNGSGMYRKFLSGVKAKSPGVRVVGFTATPYRLDVGHVCHRDYILNEVCYEANVGDLIRAHYLCNLRSKVSKLVPNLEGVAEVNGDYKTDELSARVCIQDLVNKTVADAISRLNAEDRKCCIWFCVDVAHGEMVRDALSARGEKVAMVTGKTPKPIRKNIVEAFKHGEFRHLVNVQVFTEGFNVKQVDAVVLLRPTLSRGLYVQMVGRGLRLHPAKEDCIILDYAKCIEEHGPIDMDADRTVPMEVCGQCGELFARAKRVCPKCGHEISEEEVREHDVRDEKRRRIRRMHDEIASCREILAQEHGGVTKPRLVNGEPLVKRWLLVFALKDAVSGREYHAKRGRTVPATVVEWRDFDEGFFEYAKYVPLTNLPDVLKDYFESPGEHRSEELRRKREERKRKRQAMLKKWGLGVDNLLKDVDLGSPM